MTSQSDDQRVSHTEGPWSISSISDTIINGAAHPLCFVYAPAVESILLKRARADARLIAAAPELLQALKDLLRDEKLDDGDERLGHSRAQAAIAIAKAEGRS